MYGAAQCPRASAKRVPAASGLETEGDGVRSWPDEDSEDGGDGLVFGWSNRGGGTALVSGIWLAVSSIAPCKR